MMVADNTYREFYIPVREVEGVIWLEGEGARHLGARHNAKNAEWDRKRREINRRLARREEVHRQEIKAMRAIADAARPQDVANVYLERRGYSRRNYKITFEHLSGRTLKDVANEFGISAGRAGQIVLRAKRLYARQSMGKRK